VEELRPLGIEILSMKLGSIELSLDDPEVTVHDLPLRKMPKRTGDEPTR
jgi:hypothetical protein